MLSDIPVNCHDTELCRTQIENGNFTKSRTIALLLIQKPMQDSGQGHSWRNQNVSFCHSVILSKCQSNLSIINRVITILAKFNNLTLKVKVI